jgi:RNA polymerase sigma factor (sigma-70 family)
MAVTGRDLELARDVTAEAFARALERWDRVGSMSSPGGWTYRVALNVLRRRLRRGALEERLLRRAPGREPPPLTDQGVGVWEAVASLPPRTRTAVALRYLGGLTEAEVADAMGVAPGTVAATLHAGRQRLAVLLTDALPEEVNRA